MAETLISAIDRPTLPPLGQKERGVLRFSHPSLSGWEWPYVAARGLSDGPNVALISGVHAGEYPAIVANIQFMKELDPAKLRGSIISIPIVDPPAFYARSAFVCPIDGKNPNRCFPGSPTGTFSEVLAHAIFSNILTPASHVIDLHGGDVYEHLAPFVIRRGSGNAEIDDVALGMARAFGAPHVVATKPSGAPLTGTTSASCAAAGIPAITTEVGGRGLYSDAERDAQKRGIQGVLRYLGALEGEPEIPANQRILHSSNSVLSPLEGLWFPEVTLLQEVSAGQRIGRIEDIFGTVLAEIHAPLPGVILYLTSSPAVREGGILGSVGAE